MVSNDKLKEIEIINRTCYYFVDLIKTKYFNSDNILMNEKSYENILVYDISYKTLVGAKLLRIRFEKINGFIRVFDQTRYLVLFGPEKYDTIFQ